MNTFGRHTTLFCTLLALTLFWSCSGKPTDAESGDECDASEDYYDSPQCIIDEEMPNLFTIGYEIGRLEQISSMYGFYGSSDDIRVIYFLA